MTIRDDYGQIKKWGNLDWLEVNKKSPRPDDTERLSHSSYDCGASYEKWRLVPNDDLERTFQALKSQWKAETQFVSSGTDIILNQNYQSIIGLGAAVIPLLLKDLEKTRSHWFWALMAISRENPVNEADTGNVERMTEAWLRWGRQKGYV